MNADEIFEALCMNDRVFIHYTDAAVRDIVREGVLYPDGKGWLYFTREPFTQEQAHTNLFIMATTHAGRGSHIVVIDIDPGIPLDPCGYYEFRTQQSLRLDQHRVLYAGENPFK